jgi:broad specificity phosphatase PhoE
MTSIVFVRHGETALGSSTRFFGATDVPLSPLGVRQMERTRDALSGVTFDRVLASPLCRSIESARIIAGARGLGIEIVEPFREVDFGAWEGLTEAEIAVSFPGEYHRWKGSGLEFAYPGGEARAAFDARVRAAAARVFVDRGTTLAVLHKGVIRVALRALVGTSELEHRPIPLGSIHRLDRRDGDGLDGPSPWRLGSADTAHLGEDLLPGT